jgi:hypothetical protein
MAFTLAGFLMAIAGSLVARVIVSLGLGWVSFQGIAMAIQEMRAHIETAWNAGGTMIDILALAGFGDAIGIMIAALMVRATMYGYAYLGKAIST